MNIPDFILGLLLGLAVFGGVRLLVWASTSSVERKAVKLVSHPCRGCVHFDVVRSDRLLRSKRAYSPLFICTLTSRIKPATCRCEGYRKETPT